MEKKGRWLHSFLLVASGLVGLWVMYELRRTTKGTAFDHPLCCHDHLV